jgi:hypothetical protein
MNRYKPVFSRGQGWHNESQRHSLSAKGICTANKMKEYKVVGAVVRTNNSRLSEMFVNGLTDGKGNNMFVEGDVIYSYGHHFPIAIRMKNGTFLCNEDKYSVTTGKHKSYVRRYIPSKMLISSNTKEMKDIIDNEDKKKSYYIPEPYGLPYDLTKKGEFKKYEGTK